MFTCNVPWHMNHDSLVRELDEAKEAIESAYFEGLFAYGDTPDAVYAAGLWAKSNAYKVKYGDKGD